ncbi:alpha-ketoglutarate-dependent taurine dioxygenase [Novosphingobium sp. PhB165]|nr:alpha-ketoglutarate-dependent taurine dioxygenase [Novosphingobium sp. PhB165]
MTMTSAIEITPLGGGTGASVRIEPACASTPQAARAIRDALDRYHVLIFPEAHFSDQHLLDLSSVLGSLHANDVTDDGTAPSGKGIYRIALDKMDANQLDYVKGNDWWHMDGTSYDTPGKATLLKCESAPAEGGDTGFANLHAAHAALPQDRRDQLESLRVSHCLAAVGRLIHAEPTAADFARWNAVFPPREHPLVWHQKDANSVLLIGSTADHVVGMEASQSRQLLDELLEWCTQDRFTYRHTWRAGDLVIFNNPALLHRSYPYPASAGRILHRTTLRGEETIA